MASLIPPVVKKTVTGDYGYTHAETPDLTGRVALVTGGTNGIGLSLSRTLYAHGAKLYVLGHRTDVGNAALAYIKSGKLEDAPHDYAKGFGGQEDTSGGGDKTGSVEFVECNFEELKQVNKVAKDLAGKLDRLDIAAFVAGQGVNAFTRTSEGLDSHLAVNNLSHHILLSHLWPVLRKTERLPGADVRIVNMSSELHRATFGGPGTFGGKFKDVQEFKEDIGPNNLYARTKLCVILFTKAILQRHIQPSSSQILTFATHPGAVSTGQQDQLHDAYGALGKIMEPVVRLAMRRPDQGSFSALWCSVSPELRSGKWENGTYFTDPAELGGESGEAKDQELIDNFYTQSEKVIKEIVGADNAGKWS